MSTFHQLFVAKFHFLRNFEVLSIVLCLHWRANMANENRKATVESFLALIKSANLHAGLVAHSYRVYEGPGRAKAKTQTDAATAIQGAGTQISQPELSDFENGNSIPGSTALPAVMGEYGFDPASGSGGEAFCKFLEWHRDYFSNLEKLVIEQPK
jgi:hypothetical protein